MVLDFIPDFTGTELIADFSRSDEAEALTPSHSPTAPPTSDDGTSSPDDGTASDADAATPVATELSPKRTRSGLIHSADNKSKRSLVPSGDMNDDDVAEQKPAIRRK